MTAVFALLFGLVFGSFANVVIWRTPRGETVFKPARSYCPSCGETLRNHEIIPVVSWLWLRGKCAHCGVKIPARYMAVELLTGALFIVTSFFINPAWWLPFGGLFVFFLVCVAFIDHDSQIIPDGLIVFGAVCGILFNVANFVDSYMDSQVWLDALFGAVAGAAPLMIIDLIVMLVLKKDGFGYGDVKLMAVCGLFLGWKYTLFAFFLAAILGGIWAMYLVASKKAEKGTYIAFGPFLVSGTLIAFWWAEPILNLYFGYFV